MAFQTEVFQQRLNVTFVLIAESIKRCGFVSDDAGRTAENRQRYAKQNPGGP
jgi:hypothetical protein